MAGTRYPMLAALVAVAAVAVAAVYIAGLMWDRQRHRHPHMGRGHEWGTGAGSPPTSEVSAGLALRGLQSDDGTLRVRRAEAAVTSADHPWQRSIRAALDSMRAGLEGPTS
eukprot:gene9203-8286_t